MGDPRVPGANLLPVEKNHVRGSILRTRSVPGGCAERGGAKPSRRAASNGFGGDQFLVAVKGGEDAAALRCRKPVLYNLEAIFNITMAVCRDGCAPPLRRTDWPARRPRPGGWTGVRRRGVRTMGCAISTGLGGAVAGARFQNGSTRRQMPCAPQPQKLTGYQFRGQFR